VAIIATMEIKKKDGEDGRKLNENGHTNKSTYQHRVAYEGWNFNSGNYLFTTDTK